MIGAMHDFLEEYKLAPIYWDWAREEGEQWRADIARAKKLLAPYGIDPAPWADEAGNRRQGWVAEEPQTAPADAQSLPEKFRGYSTARLLKAWDHMVRRVQDRDEEPLEIFSVMHGLLYEYKLVPVDWNGEGEQWREEIVRAKKLLAPYGVDPAPWADEDGNELGIWAPRERGPEYYLDEDGNDEVLWPRKYYGPESHEDESEDQDADASKSGTPKA